MNNDLISREALKKSIEELKKSPWYCEHRDTIDGIASRQAQKEALQIVENTIDNAPAVEYTFEEAFQKTVCEQRLYCPARPQGEWITRHKLNSFGQDVVCFECNKCGEYKVPLYHLLITEPLKVCPNCGADMQKGGAENDL